jgi:hypothetical protein
MSDQLRMEVVIKGEDRFGITADADRSLLAFGERFTSP